MGIIGRVFSDKDWRDDLDQELVRKLEKLLKRTKTYEDAYNQSGSPAMAQLWVGVAEVFSQIERMNSRLRKVENRQKKILRELEGDDGDAGGIEDAELRDSLDTY